jgi:hypothetical protein
MVSRQGDEVEYWPRKKVAQKLHAIILPSLMKNKRAETLVFTGLFFIVS